MPQTHQSEYARPAKAEWYPARHRPRHLRAGPGLEHATGEILDAAPRDLAGAARPDVHGPAPRHAVELGSRARVGGIALEPALHLRDREQACRHPGAREARRLEGRSIGARRRGRRSRRGQRQSAERQRAESSAHAATAAGSSRACCRGSSAGVTSTIATAWATILPTPRCTRIARSPRLARYTSVETTRNRAPWTPTCPRWARNVQCRLRV